MYGVFTDSSNRGRRALLLEEDNLLEEATCLAIRLADGKIDLYLCQLLTCTWLQGVIIKQVQSDLQSFEGEVKANVALRNAGIPGVPRIFCHKPFYGVSKRGRPVHAMIFEDGGRYSTVWDASCL